MKARAQRRSDARATYEDAIERGKAAVLHEEVLRGVHMVSVAHLAPGAEIEVVSTWATALSYTGDRGHLRIPLTVGDIYGRSGLPDSDEIVHGGPAAIAELTVRCVDGVVSLLGTRLDQGRARIPLNAPIDLEVMQTTNKELHGSAADGRLVELTISPQKGGDATLDTAVLIDHSGSMGETCSGGKGSPTKHQAVVNGLKAVAGRLRSLDAIDVWEFDSRLTQVGSSKWPKSIFENIFEASNGIGRKRLLGLVERLSGPDMVERKLAQRFPA